MPKNRFPDSLAKRELRRQDARRLAVFRTRTYSGAGLQYCGMPSVEFHDIQAWQEHLRSICAVEIEDDVLSDMQIEWDRLALGLPIQFQCANILEFLQQTRDAFDLYNLDFYGGFLFPKKRGDAACVDAIRAMIARQRDERRSFALIVTFNVRDKGLEAYLKFIDDVPAALSGWKNVSESCRAHAKTHAGLLKLCFPYFCWNAGMTDSFTVTFENPVVYQSESSTLLHFYAEFMYEPRPLPSLSHGEVLAEFANRPLIRLDGRIEKVEMRPPPVTKT